MQKSAVLGQARLIIKFAFTPHFLFYFMKLHTVFYFCIFMQIFKIEIYAIATD